MMAAWQTVRIDQMGRVVTGKTPPSERPEEFGDIYPFVTPSDIPATQKHIEVERYLSERGMESHKRIQLPSKSVCVVCIGATVGKICMTRKRSISNQQINSIIPFEGKSDPDFVYYISTTLRDSLVAFAGGAATPIINKSTFSSIKLLVPRLEEQQKIAAILSAYDDLIENNQRRIALLEKMAEEIYREWFVRMRFPGHEQVKIIKGVPEGWRASCLRDIAKFTMGQSPSSEFYNEVGNGLPFHQGVGTYGDRFPRTTIYCSEDGRRAKKSDILFSVRAPVGRLNIADQEMIIGRGLAAIRHKKEHNSYLYYLLKTAFVNEDIIGNGSIFNSVGKDELAKFPVFEPEPSLVERFDIMISKMDEQIAILVRATMCLRSSRDLLLPRLISGKLSVENLDIRFPPSMEEAS